MGCTPVAGHCAGGRPSYSSVSSRPSAWLQPQTIPKIASHRITPFYTVLLADRWGGRIEDLLDIRAWIGIEAAGDVVPAVERDVVLAGELVTADALERDGPGCCVRRLRVDRGAVRVV